MIFSNDILLRIAIFILAVCGFFVAKHIRNHKKSGRALVCPLNMDCHGVVHSDYSKFFGMPVEVMGMIYYGFISIAYLLFIFIPKDLPNILVGIMALTSIIAFLFSIYLIGVQLFVLKKGCYWCFVSAFFCILIFTFTLMSYNFGQIMQFFQG